MGLLRSPVAFIHRLLLKKETPSSSKWKASVQNQWKTSRGFPFGAGRLVCCGTIDTVVQSHRLDDISIPLFVSHTYLSGYFVNRLSFSKFPLPYEWLSNSNCLLIYVYSTCFFSSANFPSRPKKITLKKANRRHLNKTFNCRSDLLQYHWFYIYDCLFLKWFIAGFLHTVCVNTDRWRPTAMTYREQSALWKCHVWQDCGQGTITSCMANSGIKAKL